MSDLYTVRLEIVDYVYADSPEEAERIAVGVIQAKGYELSNNHPNVHITSDRAGAE